jgi:hypothetical protein
MEIYVCYSHFQECHRQVVRIAVVQDHVRGSDCLLLDKMSGDIKPAHCQWLRSCVLARLCFERYFGYFGYSTGQPFGAALQHEIAQSTYVRKVSPRQSYKAVIYNPM